MKIKAQRRLAGEVLGTSPSKVRFDPAKLQDVKEAITKHDIRSLIIKGTIQKRLKNGPSKVRSAHNRAQKRKGRRAGHGTRKGKATARLSQKQAWIKKVRIQRKFLSEIKVKKLITPSIYRKLYLKSKGGFFRSKAHLKLYVQEYITKK